MSSTIALQSCSNHKAAFVGIETPKLDSLKGSGFVQHELDELTRYLKEKSATTGMVVLYDGHVVYEYGNTQEVSYNASVRKSILAILYGKYVEDGSIDLNQSIGELGIDEDSGLLPQEKLATVNNIITARSGVFHIPANGGYDKNNALKRGSVKHGGYFLYNNWDFNVAGYILEQATGRSIYEEIEHQLAIPLGMQDWNIKNQKRKVNESKSRYSAYHMYFSTRDMAKIGQLMLNKGRWNGKQLISKEWINKITTTVTPVDVINKRYGRNKNSKVQFSYAYMWWIIEKLDDISGLEGAYSATGWGGQFITVIPKRKLVIVHKTKLSKLTLWGLTQGGVGDNQYWEIVKMLLSPLHFKTSS
ncbi:MAG: beta-lactamase family protein [Proteobacteria bacterium]|nr:beta-lactamase family protein [Pseudomonadota bacterium]